MTHLVYFLLIGLCAGWLAGLFTKGKGFGLLGNLIIGVTGALLGGFLLKVVGMFLADLILATVGAVALLAVLQYATKKRR